MEVTILIVNWNGNKFIEGCLESIRRHVTVRHEVIVVDNGSTDGSPELIERAYPWVKLVRSAENLGFAGGNNLGASTSIGKYILLLNCDTILQTDIADAVRIAESDRTIGAVGALMLNGEYLPIPSAFRFPTPNRLWRIASLSYPGKCHPEIVAGVPVRKCDFVEASFLLTPRQVWQEIGGMDARNFMYCEDADYGKGLANAGYRSVQAQTIRYVHFVGYNHSRMAHLFGGFVRYHRKFSGPFTRMYAYFVLRIGLLLRMPWYWCKGRLGDSQGRIAYRYAVDLNRNWKKAVSEPRQIVRVSRAG